MIRRDLAVDEGIARLSDGAARLYFMLYPHLDSYGKWCGGPGTIAENIVPLLKWSRKKIMHYLVELNNNTSLSIWTQFQRVYVHDLQFSRRQKLREDRMGQDILPNYPGPERMKTETSPYSLPDYVPDQVPHEVKDEVKDKEDLDSAAPARADGTPQAAAEDKGNGANKEESPSQKQFREVLEQRRAVMGIRPDGSGRIDDRPINLLKHAVKGSR